MSFFDSLNVVASGLTAERMRVDVTSSNLTNAHTTRTAEGGPYKRRDPVFVSHGAGGDFLSALEGQLEGVHVSEIKTDDQAPRLVYDPKHPDANKEGFVAMPNITMVEEMVNMMSAQRSYEAQLTAMHGLVDMAEKALSLGR